MRFIAIFVAIVLALPALAQDSSNDIHTYTVANVHRSKAGNCFLNIGAPYPNQTMTIFIPRAYAAAFNIEGYAGKRIEVKGPIVDYKGKPEIVVTSPSQIRIVP